MSLSLKEILEMAFAKEASDIHLKAGLVPVIRKHGKLRPLGQGLVQLSAQQIEAMAFEIMDDEQRQHFLQFKEVDCGYGIPGLGRFRVNIFKQRGSVRMVIRTISSLVPTIEDLQLPPVIKKLADLERGLVLVTGITGSGKSSTLAAIINEVNNTKNKHILTIEDPIEYLIRDKKSIVSQREIGQDTTTFAHALRAGLRQDPDVILIGEMRDKDTIEIALTAAETGHLVLSTLHTFDAQETINRILGVFDHNQHDQVRRQLAGVLKGIVSQRLCRRKDKGGFVPAVEVLIVNQRTRECIEDAERNLSLRQIMEESRDTVGMQTFDQSLADLVNQGLIEFPEALRMSTNPEDFQLRFSGVSAGNQNWNQGGNTARQPMENSNNDNKEFNVPAQSGFELELGNQQEMPAKPMSAVFQPPSMQQPLSPKPPTSTIEQTQEIDQNEIPATVTRMPAPAAGPAAGPTGKVPARGGQAVGGRGLTNLVPPIRPAAPTGKKSKSGSPYRKGD